MRWYSLAFFLPLFISGQALSNQTAQLTPNELGPLTGLSSTRYTQSIAYETGPAPQFNGNISGITYQNQGDVARTYRYAYDKLNRLLSARMPNGAFDERSISYDRNGNILRLSRTDNSAVVDSLIYSYSGNRLLKVNDQITAVTTNHFPKNDQHHSLSAHYTYDANGNIVSDVNRGLTSVTYNQLNKPVRVTFNTGNWIEYTYDASGNKLKKTTNTGVTTDYINGIEYDVLVLKRLPMGEGYIEALPNSTYEYRYTLKDHLGNTRSVLAQGGTVLQRNHYYAFGLSIASLDFSGPGAAWKYQYNGKERQTDFGFNWYDYGFRFYDATIARFPQIDPLAHDFVYLTPYQYAGNGPISNIDLDGLEPLQSIIPQITAWYASSPNAQAFFKGVGNYARRESMQLSNPKEAILTTMQAMGGARFLGSSPEKISEAQGALISAVLIEGGLTVATMGGTASATVSDDIARGGTGVANGLDDLGRYEKSGSSSSQVLPELVIDGTRYPEAAQHALDASASGVSMERTIQRSSTAAKRAEALSGTPARPGLDRDEFPPAFLRSEGEKASVRHIDPSDNRGAGASLGNQARALPDNTRVKIRVIPPKNE